MNNQTAEARAIQMKRDFLPVRTDRNQEGRFLPGNKAAIGHSSKSRDNLFVFRRCITENEIQELARILMEKAMGGDLAAIKTVLDYVLPRPAMVLSIDDRKEREEAEEERCERLRSAIR